MKVYPAIDLMSKKAVRLFKGKREKVKVYGDPLEIAEEFSHYFDFIHIVDLDGAFYGRPKNMDVVESIIKKVHLNVELGGGFRNFESIRDAYEIGVKNVIISTRAFDIEFLKNITDTFNGITVSIDVKKDQVFIKGWEKRKNISAENVYRVLKQFVKRFIYTSIESDGALMGIEKIKRFWKDEEFIYAGGVSSIDDIDKLKLIGFSGVIVGKSIYEKRISLDELKEASD